MATHTRRAILADITEKGLDPTQAHSTIARNGHLTGVDNGDQAEVAAIASVLKLALKQLAPDVQIISENEVLVQSVEETVAAESEPTSNEPVLEQTLTATKETEVVETTTSQVESKPEVTKKPETAKKAKPSKEKDVTKKSEGKTPVSS